MVSNLSLLILSQELIFLLIRMVQYLQVHVAPSSV